MTFHHIHVSGRLLPCSAQLWDALEGPKPALPMGWESNGCSGGSLDTLVMPLTKRRFKLWPACVVHDYHYRFPVLGTLPAPVARKLADDILRENITTLVRLQGGGPLTAAAVAWLYWGRVRIWGAASWRHWGTSRPLGMLARVWEVYGKEL